MSIPELKAKAQKICNEYIRYRDKDLPCICCGKFATSFYLTGGEWDAGHYRSTGSADHLRFDERNIHKQLKNCNRDKAGRVVEYRQGLIKRFSVEYVEALESSNEIVKWTRDGLIKIALYYKAKLKELKRAS